MQDIKIQPIINEHICPHCNQKIIINTRLTMPTITWILRPEDVKKAKEKVIVEIKKIQFTNPEDQKKLLDYLTDESTVVAPEEVDPLIIQVMKDNIKVDDQKV